MPESINVNPNIFSEIIISSSLNGGFVPAKYKDYIKNEKEDRKTIIIAAAPKSGSTFLTQTLCKITGYEHYRLTEGYDTNEHDLYLPNLLMMNKKGCVSQLHIKGSYHNASHIQTFGITPVILVRNIFDTVISLVKDLRKKQKQEGWELGRNGYSFLWQDSSLTELSESQFTDMVIELALPWYINFYVSWYRLCQKGVINGLWVTYEDLMADKEKSIMNILKFLKIPNISNIPQDLLDQKYGTFRQGSSGSGEDLLTKFQKESIQSKFKYYKDIDFTMFGIK